MSSASKPHSTNHSDTNTEPNLLGHIDTKGMLNDIFGVHKQRCIQNGDNNNAFDIGDPIIGKYVEVHDEPNSNDVLNEEEHIEDARYRRLVEQAEKELFSRSKFSKLSFLLHLFHLKSMHGWSITSFYMLLELLLLAFPQINPFLLSWSRCKQLKKDLGL